ncbi:serine/threonine-protein kinase grp isoform X1 [Manduca sexta]|uniref:serine/threonine-protein kinase grp isoform X1 n=1 Tax=Manduca sexta TaxID=7130 RepID=UPI00188F9A6E|nr:serine/threonine-protein kinase grp isoform X1 [Manduca sexta]
MAEFVEGWLVAQVLGEGAYGEVRLLVHARSGAAVALKVSRGGAGAREAALQRALRHPHVLRCLGERTHLHHHYMFLEYAQGGELFDKIEPDVGMPESAARRYWRQTLAGLEYLHARGVAHRDIKPENLLLDHHDDVKISDFGMATVFRHGARERALSRVCGTLPYAAPEVLRAEQQPYRAPPADLWAAALVLLAMLAGELPWERAAEEDARFAAWRAWQAGGGAAPTGPWRKVSRGARALLRAALRPEPAARASLAALLSHAWTQDGPLAEGSAREWRSQPAAADARPLSPALSLADMDALLTHSQPARDSDLLLASQPGAALGPALAARLVRRLTRVWLRCDPAPALRALADALRARGHTWRRLHPRLLAVECGEEVRMRAWVVPCAAGGEARSLLEFRRSRGCGLQFKRRFLELRAALSPLQAAPPPHADLLAAPLAEPLLSQDGTVCT